MMDFSFLSKTALFRGTTPQEAEAMLGCLGGGTRAYSKGDTILRAGECADSMGLVLSGSATVECDDLWGNKSILGHVAAGEVFAETYACVPDEPLMVSVVACEACEVLFLNASRLTTTCSAACVHHARLIGNLLQIFAHKSLGLSRRILHTASKTIRGRLLSYLSEQAKLRGSYRFTIPFNRRQLADYLGVDRSALSAELSRMQDEGLIRYQKNDFTIVDW